MLERHCNAISMLPVCTLTLALVGAGWPQVAVAVPSLDKVSKGKLSTKLVGSGFVPGQEVKIEVTDPTTGEDVTAGSVTADSKGKFSTEWGNVLSTAAAIQIGMTVHAKQGDSTDVTVKAKKDTGVLGWALEKLLSDAGPLRTDFTTTELADAGFTGKVDLVAVSSNARIVSETTTFDQATDTITTIGFYDVLAPGPVIGTYEAVGTFTHLFDPVTEAPVTGLVTLTDSSDAIGTTVPEPGPTVMTLTGLLMLAATARAAARNSGRT